MNVSVALIFFAILKTDGGGFHMQRRYDMPANFGHQVPKSVLLFHVQVVEAGYVAKRCDHNVTPRQGLRGRYGDPVLAGDPGVVRKNRAEEAVLHV